MIRFGSFCSGIGSPEVAWTRSLDWQPQFFSEIEPFPCAVLAHHFPNVPNLGDMEKIDAQTIRRYPVDVVVAGTPCQSFSVAGLRAGMADPRGNLALVLLRLIDWLRPRWLVWENVPGVHSSWSDEAAFAPSEESAAPIGEARRIAESLGLDLGADFGAGDFEEVDQSNDFDSFVAGLEQLGYGVATRILDAQYFGVPQRRNRVFVVGCLGSWTRAAAVLLERHGLSGNPPPRREAGKGIAASLTRGADSGGEGGYAGRRREDDVNLIANCLDRHMGSGGPDDNAAQANHLVPDVVSALCANGKAAGSATHQDAESGMLVVTHSLRAEGFDASEDGTGRGTPLVPVWQSGGDVRLNVSESHTSALQRCQTPAIAIPILEVGKGTSSRGAGPNGCGIGAEGDPIFTLQAVRRLTPMECERLQGFPDLYTDVEFRGKRAADGPRYRALGNAMCVNVLRWIGRRIEAVDAMQSGEAVQP